MSLCFGVVGGGAWGTALAQVIAAKSFDVRLWAHEAETVAKTSTSTMRIASGCRVCLYQRASLLVVSYRFWRAVIICFWCRRRSTCAV